MTQVVYWIATSRSLSWKTTDVRNQSMWDLILLTSIYHSQKLIWLIFLIRLLLKDYKLIIQIIFIAEYPKITFKNIDKQRKQLTCATQASAVFGPAPQTSAKRLIIRILAPMWSRRRKCPVSRISMTFFPRRSPTNDNCSTSFQIERYADQHCYLTLAHRYLF